METPINKIMTHDYFMMSAKKDVNVGAKAIETPKDQTPASTR